MEKHHSKQLLNKTVVEQFRFSCRLIYTTESGDWSQIYSSSNDSLCENVVKKQETIGITTAA